MNKENQIKTFPSRNKRTVLLINIQGRTAIKDNKELS